MLKRSLLTVVPKTTLLKPNNLISLQTLPVAMMTPQQLRKITKIVVVKHQNQFKLESSAVMPQTQTRQILSMFVKNQEKSAEELKNEKIGFEQGYGDTIKVGLKLPEDPKSTTCTVYLHLTENVASELYEAVKSSLPSIPFQSTLSTVGSGIATVASAAGSVALQTGAAAVSLASKVLPSAITNISIPNPFASKAKEGQPATTQAEAAAPATTSTDSNAVQSQQQDNDKIMSRSLWLPTIGTVRLEHPSNSTQWFRIEYEFDSASTPELQKATDKSLPIQDRAPIVVGLLADVFAKKVPFANGIATAITRIVLSRIVPSSKL